MAPYRPVSGRVHLERVMRRAATSVPTGSRVLDAGSGEAPYAPLFAAHSYETADFMQVDKAYAEQTYVCDLRDIPVEDGRFDLVVCTQVLEHVPDPAAVLAELQRVLRPGGVLWVTAPLLYEEHEQPHDYFRYTQFSLRHLSREAGMEVEELSWLEGYFGTLAYELAYAARVLPGSPAAWGGGVLGLVRAVFALAGRRAFSVLAALVDRADAAAPRRDFGMPKNYVLVLRKPAASG